MGVCRSVGAGKRSALKRTNWIKCSSIGGSRIINGIKKRPVADRSIWPLPEVMSRVAVLCTKRSVGY